MEQGLQVLRRGERPPWSERTFRARPAEADKKNSRRIHEVLLKCKEQNVWIRSSRYVDAHYFGYMDEEDGQMLPNEAEAERKARAEAIENFEMDKELAQMKNGN